MKTEYSLEALEKIQENCHQISNDPERESSNHKDVKLALMDAMAMKNMAWDDLSVLGGVLEDLLLQKTIYTASVAQTRAELACITSRIEYEELELTDAQSKKDILVSQFENLENQVTCANAELEMTHNDIHSLEQQQEGIVDRIALLSRSLASASDLQADLDADIAQKSRLSEELEDHNNELAKHAGFLANQVAVDTLTVYRLEKERIALKDEIDALRVAVETMRDVYLEFTSGTASINDAVDSDDTTSDGEYFLFNDEVSTSGANCETSVTATCSQGAYIVFGPKEVELYGQDKTASDECSEHVQQKTDPDSKSPWSKTGYEIVGASNEEFLSSDENLNYFYYSDHDDDIASKSPLLPTESTVIRASKEEKQVEDLVSDETVSDESPMHVDHKDATLSENVSPTTDHVVIEVADDDIHGQEVLGLFEAEDIALQSIDF
jgi:hypothetical protein